MRLIVHLSAPLVPVGSRTRRKFVPAWSDDVFVTTVYRLIGPLKPGPGGRIQADGFLPEKYERNAHKDRFQPDGSYRFDIHVNSNRKTLAPFLESGLLEMDVTEVES